MHPYWSRNALDVLTDGALLKSPCRVLGGTMTTHPWRRIAVATTAAGLLLPIATAWAAPTPGASGIGDPYYPEYGNGGYDVGHYDIAVQYDRATDTLTGTTTLTATRHTGPEHVRPRFRPHRLIGRRQRRRAQSARASHELVVTPQSSAAGGRPDDGHRRLRGQPSSIVIPAYGYLALDPDQRRRGRGRRAGDRRLVVPRQRPPARQGDLRHQRDRAARRGGPEQRRPGLRRSTGGNRTWHWRENSPMASYLAFFVDRPVRHHADRPATGCR